MLSDVLFFPNICVQVVYFVYWPLFVYFVIVLDAWGGNIEDFIEYCVFIITVVFMNLSFENVI